MGSDQNVDPPIWTTYWTPFWTPICPLDPFWTPSGPHPRFVLTPFNILFFHCGSAGLWEHKFYTQLF